MLTAEQTQQLLRKPESLILLDGFDPESKTLMGPFPCVGDCISAETRYAAAYMDSINVGAGDLGIWFMPSCEAGEQFACKWLVQDGRGSGWLACKYFAVRYRPGFHRAAGRVVAIVSGELGSFDTSLACRLAAEMRDLRACPPVRDDVIVFPYDLLDLHGIVCAIDRRLEMS